MRSRQKLNLWSKIILRTRKFLKVATDKHVCNFLQLAISLPTSPFFSSPYSFLLSSWCCTSLHLSFQLAQELEWKFFTHGWGATSISCYQWINLEQLAWKEILSSLSFSLEAFKQKIQNRLKWDKVGQTGQHQLAIRSHDEISLTS